MPHPENAPQRPVEPERGLGARINKPLGVDPQVFTLALKQRTIRPGFAAIVGWAAGDPAGTLHVQPRETRSIQTVPDFCSVRSAAGPDAVGNLSRNKRQVTIPKSRAHAANAWAWKRRCCFPRRNLLGVPISDFRDPDVQPWCRSFARTCSTGHPGARCAEGQSRRKPQIKVLVAEHQRAGSGWVTGRAGMGSMAFNLGRGRRCSRHQGGRTTFFFSAGPSGKLGKDFENRRVQKPAWVRGATLFGAWLVFFFTHRTVLTIGNGFPQFF